MADLNLTELSTDELLALVYRDHAGDDNPLNALLRELAKRLDALDI